MSLSLVVTLQSVDNINGKTYYTVSGVVVPEVFASSIAALNAGVSEIILTSQNIPLPSVFFWVKKQYDAATGILGETLSGAVGWLGSAVQGVYVAFDSGVDFVVTTFQSLYGEGGTDFAEGYGGYDIAGMFTSSFPGFTVYYPGPCDSVNIDVLYTRKDFEYSQFRASFLWPFNGSFPTAGNILANLEEFSYQDSHANFGQRYFKGSYPYYNSALVNFDPSFFPPSYLQYYNDSVAQYWLMPVQIPLSPEGYVLPCPVVPTDNKPFLPFLTRSLSGGPGRNIANLPGAWPATRGSFAPGVSALKFGGQDILFGNEEILVR